MIDLLIITGASKGIGRSIVDKCSDGCKNMIAIASSDELFSIIPKCNLIPLQLNLEDYIYVNDKVSSEVSKLENINSIGIILCGAQLGEVEGLLSSNLVSWEKLYSCNVLGNLAVVQACKNKIPYLNKLRVVFFAGGGAVFGVDKFVNYSLTKCAIVRAAENLSLELNKYNIDSSVIACSPGAVKTGMLEKNIKYGGEVRTFTNISEPTNFVYKFINDELPCKELNGRLLHVRDDFSKIDLNNPNMCKLRRIENR